MLQREQLFAFVLPLFVSFKVQMLFFYFLKSQSPRSSALKMDEPAQQQNEPVQQQNREAFVVERQRIQANELPNQLGINQRFGVIRDRIFQAMLVRISIPYHQNVPRFLRRVFEYIALINAILLLSLLIYTHFLIDAYPAKCLEKVREHWPRKGILRVEVIQNLDEFREMQARLENDPMMHQCHVDLAQILRTGSIPIELSAQLGHSAPIGQSENGAGIEKRLAKIERPLPIWYDLVRWLIDQVNQTWHQLEDQWAEEEEDEEGEQEGFNEQTELEKQFNELSAANAEANSHNKVIPVYLQLVEFSVHYGLLKLNSEMRQELDVNVLTVQFDPERDVCFKDWREHFLMRHLVGMDELVLTSVRQLFDNRTERGYLRDLIGGELYHFVNVSPSSSSTYMTALLVMLIFTFVISMLLRFSHDQMLVFIVDLFQMFELNHPLIFPIAPLLTVILALVGMETIMSEIFNDTTTAFYVILLVWVADQYDAIFCHSSIGRRHWLRFFYLYHFAFYAYHYRYNGLYGGLALLTSAAFTLHSMVYFFHHFELPYIVYQEQLHNMVMNLQDNAGPDGTIDLMRIRRVVAEGGVGTAVAFGGHGQMMDDVYHFLQSEQERNRLGPEVTALLERLMANEGNAQAQAQQQQPNGGQQVQAVDGEQRQTENDTTASAAAERVAQQIVSETLRGMESEAIFGEIRAADDEP